MRTITARAGPRVDGRVDPDEWAGVAPLTAFTQKQPEEGRPALEATGVRFALDGENLYVAVDCVQERYPVVARLARRDRVIEADRVTIDLDTRGDGASAFHFEVNAAGAVADAIRYDDEEIAWEWDGVWEAATSRRDGGWAAELRIPLSTLRIAGGDAWGVQVRRYVSARQEIDELAFIPRGERGEVSRYTHVDSLQGVHGRAGIELRPFVSARVERGRGDGSDARVSAGGEAGIRINRDLRADLTFNPDFGQVEADREVLDLSRFEVFFPEKRPFFVEGIDLFQTPAQVLYTRRIGQTPTGATLQPGDRLLEPPRPTPIWGAGKLTGSLGRTQVAALTAVTGGNQAPVEDETGARVDRRIDVPAWFGVTRVKRTLGGGHVGAFATSLLRFDDDADAYHDAAVGGVDGRWRTGAWSATGSITSSMIRGGPARALPDGTTIGAGDLGSGAQLTLERGGQGLAVELVADAASRRFELNDAGFLRRQNVAHVFAAVGWHDTTSGRWLREQRSLLELFESRNLDGLLLSRGIQLNTHLVLDSYWGMFTELHYRPAHFDDREIGDGRALERAGLLGWELELESDPRAPVVGSWSSTLQALPGGVYLDAGTAIAVHLLPQLDLELEGTLVHADGEPRFIDVDDAGVPRFGRQRADGLGMIGRLSWTVTPRLSVQGFTQLFYERLAYGALFTAPTELEVIHLDDLDPAAPGEPLADHARRFDANLVLRWEWRLGSTFFLVYSRAQESGATPLEVLLAKLSYWWG